jgi:hypothetical protein
MQVPDMEHCDDGVFIRNVVVTAGSVRLRHRSSCSIVAMPEREATVQSIVSEGRLVEHRW